MTAGSGRPCRRSSHVRGAAPGDSDHARAEYYAIRVKGHLDPLWSEWFDGLAVTCVDTNDGETILSGPVADQAALHGLLAKIRDLNLTLISVTRIEPGSEK